MEGRRKTGVSILEFRQVLHQIAQIALAQGLAEAFGHGGHAARLASKIIEHYLKVAPASQVQSEG